MKLKHLIGLVFFLVGWMAIEINCHHTFAVNPRSPWPTCWDVVHEFQTKDQLLEHLKSQDERSVPHQKAYEVKPIKYRLNVDREWQEIMVPELKEIETKREIVEEVEPEPELR